MITLMSMTIFTMSSSMMMMMTPVSLGIWIITLSLTITSLIASTHSSWFGFIIFLIYIGGLLVMFAYFAALQPNQQMLTKNSSVMLPTALLILIMALNPESIMNMSKMNINLSTLYYNINLIMLTLLISILFMCMIIVVKISINLKSPLRPFFYV